MTESIIGRGCWACGVPFEAADETVDVDDRPVHLDCEGDALADVMNMRRR